MGATEDAASGRPARPDGNALIGLGARFSHALRASASDAAASRLETICEIPSAPMVTP